MHVLVRIIIIPPMLKATDMKCSHLDSDFNSNLNPPLPDVVAGGRGTAEKKLEDVEGVLMFWKRRVECVNWRVEEHLVPRRDLFIRAPG